MNINIYPNPANESLTLDLPNYESGNLMINILTLDGKLVGSYNFVNSNGEKINVSSLERGYYILDISIDEVRIPQQKFIKK